jgi:hypothetical protein
VVPAQFGASTHSFVYYFGFGPCGCGPRAGEIAGLLLTPGSAQYSYRGGASSAVIETSKTVIAISQSIVYICL